MSVPYVCSTGGGEGGDVHAESTSELRAAEHRSRSGPEAEGEAGGLEGDGIGKRTATFGTRERGEGERDAERGTEQRRESPGRTPVLGRRGASQLHHGIGLWHGQGSGQLPEPWPRACDLLRVRHHLAGARSTFFAHVWGFLPLCCSAWGCRSRPSHWRRPLNRATPFSTAPSVRITTVPGPAGVGGEGVCREQRGVCGLSACCLLTIP